MPVAAVSTLLIAVKNNGKGNASGRVRSQSG